MKDLHFVVPSVQLPRFLKRGTHSWLEKLSVITDFSDLLQNLGWLSISLSLVLIGLLTFYHYYKKKKQDCLQPKQHYKKIEKKKKKRKKGNQ